jgi:hypothetical protein
MPRNLRVHETRPKWSRLFSVNISVDNPAMPQHRWTCSSPPHVCGSSHRVYCVAAVYYFASLSQRDCAATHRFPERMTTLDTVPKDVLLEILDRVSIPSPHCFYAEDSSNTATLGSRGAMPYHQKIQSISGHQQLPPVTQYQQLPPVTVKEGYGYPVTTTVYVQGPAATVTVTHVSVVGQQHDGDPRYTQIWGNMMR